VTSVSWPERLRGSLRAGGVGRWLGLAPLVVFFCLAVFDLTRLPLWWDEGGSLDFLDRPLSAIAALDTHPPGYHLILLAWTSVLGRSPFAIRVLSALIGGLAVAAFGWALPRLLIVAHGTQTEASPPIGIERRSTGAARGQLAAVAATLLAGSPFLLHHAREARMYALAVGLAALSLGLLAPLLADRKPRLRTWIGYTLTLAAGVHVHLGFAAVIAAEALGAALSLRRWPGRWRAWLGVSLGLAAACLPWALMLVSERAVVLSDTRFEAGARVDVLAAALEVARQITAGPAADRTGLGWAPLALLGGLAIIGAWRLRGRAPEAVTLLGLAALGIAGAARINYGLEGELAVAARLGFAALPGLLGLAAVCAWGLARHWRIALLALNVLVNAPGLWQVLTQPIDPNQDMRPVIAHLQLLARPGDAVLYTFRWQNGDLESYWPAHPLDPVLRLYDRDDVAAFVDALEAGHDRAWLLNYGVSWGNTSDAIYPELEARAAIADRAVFDATELVLVAFVPPLPSPAPASRPLGAATVAFTPLVVSVHAGEVVPVRLRWNDAPQGANTFLHLGGAEAVPLAQADRAIAGLVEGELVAALLIPPGTAPGRYFVFAGLYDPATGARLPVTAPAGCDTVDRLCLGTVDVVP